MKKLVEGKTKVIYDAGDDKVIVLSKDDITAGDGTQRDVIEGKGAVSIRTTTNVFRLLNRHSIPTHFVKQTDDVRMLCIRCQMIPLEVTIRGSAAGHYLRRHPDVSEGADLKELVVEFALKDDARHDPVVVIESEDCWKLHDPERPVAPETEIDKMEPLLSPQEVASVQEIATDVFGVLREAWGGLGVKLVDLKIEFGRTADGRLVVADVIDNDSWRLWPGGEKRRQLDKQIYREGGDLDDVLRSYKLVAEMTEGFGEKGGSQNRM